MRAYREPDTSSYTGVDTSDPRVNTSDPRHLRPIKFVPKCPDAYNLAYKKIAVMGRGVATGGIYGVYIPAKSVHVNFSWGCRNNVRSAIEH